MIASATTAAVAMITALLISLLPAVVFANRGPELPSYQQLVFDNQMGASLSRYASSILYASFNASLDYYCRRTNAYNCLYIIGGPNILDPVLEPRRGQLFYTQSLNSSSPSPPRRRRQIGTGYAFSPISKGTLYADCHGNTTTRFTDKLTFDFSPGMAGVSLERVGDGLTGGGGYLTGYLSNRKSERLSPSNPTLESIGNGLDLWISCTDGQGNLDLEGYDDENADADDE